MPKGYNFALLYFLSSSLPRIIPRFIYSNSIVLRGSRYTECAGKTVAMVQHRLMSFDTVWGFGNVVNNYANRGLVVCLLGCLFLRSILFHIP